MILVTLGTHPSPMDRLVSALAQLVGDGRIREPVVIQSAAYGVRPAGLELRDVVPADELASLAREASAIVTHGGPGSITLALSAGHRPIVVPRDPAHGEHVDDHQIRFARWLASRRPILVVEDPLTGLDAALREAAAAGPAAGVGAPAAAVIDRLRTVVEDGR